MESKRTYSAEEKLNYLSIYYQSGLSCWTFTKRHNIPRSTFSKWEKKYSTHPNILSLLTNQKEAEMAAKNQPVSDNEKALQTKIKELEKALEYEKLRSRGFEIMIDIAEKELNIPVRKKSGTRR
ncbi:MAG: transposase [Bacteroidales bacterium]